MTDDTLLLRQVHPSFVQGSRVTSQAFRPTPKDESMLSVYDGDQIAAESSWRHYTEVLGNRSAGVLGVEARECTELALGVKPDPQTFPEHVLVDFSGLSKRQCEKKAKRLRSRAEPRGWFHRAEG